MKLRVVIEKRRGWDSNPQAREGAAFRVRCIAVLTPLRRYNPALPPLRRYNPALPPLRRNDEYRMSKRVTSTFDVRSSSDNHGRGGIRTHEALVTPTRSPGVRLQPLGHPSLCFGAGHRARDHADTQRLSSDHLLLTVHRLPATEIGPPGFEPGVSWSRAKRVANYTTGQAA